MSSPNESSGIYTPCILHLVPLFIKPDIWSLYSSDEANECAAGCGIYTNTELIWECGRSHTMRYACSKCLEPLMVILNRSEGCLDDRIGCFLRKWTLLYCRQLIFEDLHVPYVRQYCNRCRYTLICKRIKISTQSKIHICSLCITEIANDLEIAKFNETILMTRKMVYYTINGNLQLYDDLWRIIAGFYMELTDLYVIAAESSGSIRDHGREFGEYSKPWAGRL